MTSMTVRNLPEGAKQRFRQVAAAYGRSMEEHLRQLVIEADFGDRASDMGQPSNMGVRDVTHNFRHFEPVTDANTTSRTRIERLIALANGAGEGVFDSGKYAEIRFMTAKDAMAELRRLANGVELPLPPRMNTALEAPSF